MIEKLKNISFLSQQEAWIYLRNIWISDGFIWIHNDYGERPMNWDKKMAIKQLRNINIFINSN